MSVRKTDTVLSELKQLQKLEMVQFYSGRCFRQILGG